MHLECQRCTACCRWPGPVRVSEEEALAIAGFLGVGEAEFHERFTRLRVDRRGLSLAEKADGSCVFLDGQNCAIQPVKPKQCRDFPNRWRFPGWRESCEARVMGRSLETAKLFELKETVRNHIEGLLTKE